MSDQIKVLEGKIAQVLQKLETLKSENANLLSENSSLREEVSRLRQEFERFRVEHNDQVEAVKTKLGTLLGRIEELEQIGL
ncbi:MAG: cell division protein ZapB [Candidatus Zixiibacteriota bacterium]